MLIDVHDVIDNLILCFRLNTWVAITAKHTTFVSGQHRGRRVLFKRPTFRGAVLVERPSFR